MSELTGASALELVDVDVRLGGRQVLSGITVAANPGMPIGVAGPSGSGKSVLCRVASGALRPTSGEVRYGGRPFPDDASVVRGVVLQTHGLLRGLTAEENVALPLQTRGLARRDVLAHAFAALDAVGLADHGQRSVEELSGGERQRVGIARALAGDPHVLVADEPTAELDVRNRERVLGLLASLAARDRVVLIASDDPQVLADCGSLIRMDGGRVSQGE